jgi:hypothetical protein
MLYPELSITADREQYINLLKRYNEYVLTEIIEDRNYENEKRAMEGKLIPFITPKTFTGERSAELNIERDFEALCAFLNEHTNKDVKKMNVKEYYGLLIYVRKKLDKSQIA